MQRSRNYWLGLLFLLFSVGGIYLFNQAETIYGGDAGDLVSAIVVGGIPHPPGYPLYTLLGILFNKIIPFGSIAWKIGFLSSIPAILTVLLLYDLLILLSGSIIVSLISATVFAFVYPIWLYAEVAEVFSLNNFFTIFLLWLIFCFSKEEKRKYLYWAAVTFGLSLSHHHIIVFLLPLLAFLLYTRRKILDGKIFIKGFLLVMLGLSPYIYPLVASLTGPPVNWQGPPTLIAFLQLLTRAGYGTFTAGSFVVHQPLMRLLDVFAFADFVYKDFRILGVILFLLGVVYLFRNKKTVFYALTVGFVSYLFFLFYASFPLLENFMLGTFERFVQPLYLILTIYLSFGLYFILQILAKCFSFFQKSSKIRAILPFIFLIYPIGLFTLNFPKISILKKDFTAENLGRDILNSVPKDSLLIISTDTPLFNTQYVYYSEKKWPDIKLIHLTKLYTPYYDGQLKKYYPQLVLPDSKTEPAEKFRQLVEKNYGKYPIFSKLAFADEKGVWLPWGLLFRYFKNEDVPKEAEILRENEKLWSSFQDPLSGSLSRYQNLILSDNLRIYGLSHQEFGFWAAKRGFSKVAQEHLLSAEKLIPADLDSYTILAQVYIVEKRCEEAQKQIETVVGKDPQNLDSYYLQALNYAACFKDSQKANYFQKLYEEKSSGKETPLKKL